jgi:hypothetical protein
LPIARLGAAGLVCSVTATEYNPAVQSPFERHACSIAVFLSCNCKTIGTILHLKAKGC